MDLSSKNGRTILERVELFKIISQIAALDSLNVFLGRKILIQGMELITRLTKLKELELGSYTDSRIKVKENKLSEAIKLLKH